MRHFTVLLLLGMLFVFGMAEEQHDVDEAIDEPHRPGAEIDLEIDVALEDPEHPSVHLEPQVLLRDPNQEERSGNSVDDNLEKAILLEDPNEYRARPAVLLRDPNKRASANSRKALEFPEIARDCASGEDECRDDYPCCDTSKTCECPKRGDIPICTCK